MTISENSTTKYAYSVNAAQLRHFHDETDKSVFPRIRWETLGTIQQMLPQLIETYGLDARLLISPEGIEFISYEEPDV